MKKIGLTGGIASGKSLVARLLTARGVAIIDADQVARDVVEPGAPALAAIAIRWPAVVRDGRLDRKALGAVVFADREERLALESIVHPRIRAEVSRRFAALEAQEVPRAVYEAPLIVEKGLDADLDALIVVSAPLHLQLERLMARDGLTESEARARLEAQLPLEKKIARATFVIDNSSDLEALERQVDEVWKEVERRF